MKICHLTSVHPAFDIRVFYKECRSLARAGYDVVLIATHHRAETMNGVSIVPFPSKKNRFLRIMLSPIVMFRLALKQRAQLYHFHDPELIFTGLLLKLCGKKVIYDVHEDNVAFTKQKTYLPSLIAKSMAFFVGGIERLARFFLRIVIAEKYYKRRFPRGAAVLNYPLLREIPSGERKRINEGISLIYVGTSLEDRGALIYPKILAHVDDLEIFVVGFCDRDLAENMRAVAQERRDRLHIIGEGEFVDPQRINGYYDRYRWLAGLAIFPPTSFNMEKELTKFFEYMQAGIPIICSNFPVWGALIETTETGILVDPQRMESIVEGVEYLRRNPKIAERMGENGRRVVRETYNWDSQEKELLTLYNKLLSTNR